MRFQCLLIGIYKFLSSSYSSENQLKWDQDINPKLKNQGNICYFNSLLQCLYNIETFFYFITGQKLDGEKWVTSNIRDVIASMSIKKVPMHTNSYLENALYVMNGKTAYSLSKQHDSCEIFSFLLNKMVEESGITIDLDMEKFIQTAKNAQIIELFYSHFSNSYKCKNCGNISIRADVASIQYIQIAESVQAALEESLLSSEIIKKMCEECKINVLNEKNSEINYLSQIVTICFKSFNNRNEKTKDTIFIEENIVLKATKLKLRGFIVHIGNLASSGHYIAYVLKKESLFRFNDSRNRKLTEDQKQKILKTGRPYILFYERIEK